MSSNKWSFQYLVLAQQGVTAFMHLDCAHRFALATHGTLYAMKDVLDYNPSTLRRDHVQLKASAMPIEVD